MAHAIYIKRAEPYSNSFAKREVEILQYNFYKLDVFQSKCIGLSSGIITSLWSRDQERVQSQNFSTGATANLGYVQLRRLPAHRLCQCPQGRQPAAQIVPLNASSAWI